MEFIEIGKKAIVAQTKEVVKVIAKNGARPEVWEVQFEDGRTQEFFSEHIWPYEETEEEA